jgi:hypothetical protein
MENLIILNFKLTGREKKIKYPNHKTICPSEVFAFVGPSEVRAPAVGVAHAGGEHIVHY